MKLAVVVVPAPIVNRPEPIVKQVPSKPPAPVRTYHRNKKAVLR